MIGMEYPPEGPIRPDLIWPNGVNPVGQNGKTTLVFPIFPGWSRQVLWKKELGRGAYFIV
jgi:hypothetical protein